MDSLIKGWKRSRDSAMLQLVFFLEKDSVAARKMETSWVEDASVAVLRDWFIAFAPEVLDGMALGSMEDVFIAGPVSLEGGGDGGGVGYAFAASSFDRPAAAK